MCRLDLWLIFILIFMSYRCHGCRLVCKTSSGLNRHVQTCVQARSVISQAAQQQRAVRLREEAAKIARRTCADVSGERQMLATADVAVCCPIAYDQLRWTYFDRRTNWNLGHPI